MDVEGHWGGAAGELTHFCFFRLINGLVPVVHFNFWSVDRAIGHM